MVHWKVLKKEKTGRFPEIHRKARVTIRTKAIFQFEG